MHHDPAPVVLDVSPVLDDGAQNAATPLCWCGSEPVVPVSEAYVRCDQCSTLVATQLPIEDQAHRPSDRHDPDDVVDTALLARAVLRFRLPPGRAVVIGRDCEDLAEMLAMAGFDAIRCDGVPDGSTSLGGEGAERSDFDLVVMVDVLERGGDPRRILQVCSDLLAPAGILLLRAARRPEVDAPAGPDAAAALSTQRLRERNHLFLFSEEAIAQLMAGVGMSRWAFEQGISPEPWVIAAAGRTSLDGSDWPVVADVVAASPGGRMVVALLDAVERARCSEETAAALRAELEVFRTAAAERLAALEQATRWFEEMKQAADERLESLQRAAVEKARIDACLAEFEQAARERGEKNAELTARLERVVRELELRDRRVADLERALDSTAIELEKLARDRAEPGDRRELRRRWRSKG